MKSVYREIDRLTKTLNSEPFAYWWQVNVMSHITHTLTQMQLLPVPVSELIDHWEFVPLTCPPAIDHPKNRYHCLQCGRSYKRRDNLNRHINNECNMPNRFKCPHCRQDYRQRAQVWAHIRNLHKNADLYCVDKYDNRKEEKLIYPRYKDK